MGILNKRNAVLGWAAWTVGKNVMKVKARGAVPGRVDDSMRPNKGAIAAGLVALGGALLFWRRKREDEPG
jgi:LPXTG-motif cell wall-anchored protein